jgi:hypothetical protein
MTIAHYSKFPYAREVVSVLMVATVVLACVISISSKRNMQWFGMGVGFLAGLLLLHFERSALLITTLLPTLIHVYVFTGIFMLHGARKAPCISGYAALTIFLLAPWIALHASTTPTGYAVSDYVLDSAMPFLSMQPLIRDALGLGPDRDGLIAFMRLLAFAYTYHYLNWFSKSEIIKWHTMSRLRAAVIGIVYVVSLALYLYDFRVGFGALLALSMGHVVLELPLNIRAGVGVFGGGRRLLGE